MSWFISICDDMDALRATGAVDEDSPYRGMIDGRSGAYVHYNGNKSAIILTSIDGLELLEQLPYITVTTPEEVFGYRKQAEVDGVLQWTTESGITDGYFKDVPTGEYVDGDPIYVVERVETPTTRTVPWADLSPPQYDDDGELIPPVVIEDHPETMTIAGRPIVEYITTDVVDGYYQVAVTEQVWVEAEPYTREVPLYEEVPGDPAMLAKYLDVYDYTTPVDDGEGGTYMRPKMFAAPGGHSIDHLL